MKTEEGKNIKKEISKALDVQQKTEGATENIAVLRKFLTCIKYSSQWNAFVTTTHHRYGKLSYETHRFYYATAELVKLFGIINSTTPNQNNSTTTETNSVDNEFSFHQHWKEGEDDKGIKHFQD